VALRFLPEAGTATDLTYAELTAATNRFANVLTDLGVGHGDAVFLLTGRVPELCVAALGAWKVGAVVCPLFSAFGPEPVVQRLRLGDAKVLVTTPQLYARKVAWARDDLPGLRDVLLTGEPPAGTRSLGALLADAADTFEIPPTSPEDPAILHFTSGTTGTPKGAVHVHAAVVGHLATARLVLGLRPGRVARPGAAPRRT
jgi:acetyl-CoA synthetase